jgi:hypothetical protein
VIADGFLRQTQLRRWLMPDAPTLEETVAAIGDAVGRLLERVDAAPAQWGRFLKLDDAERYSGVSIKTLRRMIAAGKLVPLHPVKGRVVVDRLNLDAAILETAMKRFRNGRGVRTVK